MANETIMQGLLESLMQRPQDTAQQKGTVLANLISQPNPLAAYVAYSMPGQMENVAGAARGLLGLKAPVSPLAQAQQAIAANPQLLTDPTWLTQKAQELSAADPALGMRFAAGAMSAQQAQVEKNKNTAETSLARNTNTAAVAQAIQSIPDSEKYPGLSRALEGYQNQLAAEATPTDPAKVQETLTSMFTRYKLEPQKEAGKVDVEDYEFSDGTTLSLRTFPDGMVYYQGQKQDPGALGLRKGATRTASRTTPTEEVPPQKAQALLGWANNMGYLPRDPNDPISSNYADAVFSGAVKTNEDAQKWFEKMPGTPAFSQKQASIKNSTLATLQPSLNNMVQAFTLLNDPAARIGSVYSLAEDYRIGTDAARLKEALLPITSDAALTQIAEMKRVSSELGGEGTGLGAVSEIEFTSLQNRVENLRTARTKDDLQQAANDYMVHLLNIRNLNSGQPMALIEGDPTYAGLPLEPAPPGSPNEAFLLLNGTRIPVNIYNSSDEYVAPFLPAQGRN